MGKKYIIELEEKMFSNGTLDALYRVKGFRSLVFDAEGLKKLTPYEPEQKLDFCFGDEIQHIGGGMIGVITSVSDATVGGVYVDRNDQNIVNFEWYKHQVRKTGRHYPGVAKMIEALRGAANAEN